MDEYFYNGPVLEYDRLVVNNWKASTRAVSKSKALSNLSYQYKKKYNRIPGTRITLPGSIEKKG